MAGKKKVKAKKEPGIKCKSLWDHLKHIYEVQDENYFKSLTESDKKSWNTYMINRFISMNPNFLPIVNFLQQYYDLPHELYYKLLISAIPRGKYFFPYIKPGKEFYEKGLIDIIKNHFEIKSDEAVDYLNILYQDDDGKEYVKNICKKYGMDEKEIKEII
jgi:hypothetical protein